MTRPVPDDAALADDAVTVTGTAQRQAWGAGVLPEVEQVQPGLWSIPVPIPRNPLRYVLVYALELPDGVAVVDTGWDTAEAWEALTAGLARGGFQPGDVREILITHIHPDHYGLAGRLRDASGARVALHPADAALLPGRYGLDIDQVLAGLGRLLTSCGVPESVRAELTGASMGVREFVALVQPDVLLEDGARVELPGWELFTVWTPGHSPGHVCFHERERRLLLSGDHVLPRVTPNVGLYAPAGDNPLADFLDALARVRDLDVGEVLPAHEWRFRPLHRRVDQLLDHHAGRLREIETLLSETPGATVWELTVRLSWSRPWEQVTGHMRRAAVAETLAHLALLAARGLATAEAGPATRWRGAGGRATGLSTPRARRPRGADPEAADVRSTDG